MRDRGGLRSLCRAPSRFGLPVAASGFRTSCLRIFNISHTSDAAACRYMLVLYRFCPIQHRVLATATGNLGWSTYLSLKSRFKPDNADAADAKQRGHQLWDLRGRCEGPECRDSHPP
jgi:hypothetical protein